MNELDSTYDLLQSAILNDDVNYLRSCCVRMTEFPWNSFFHRNTLDLCVKHGKVQTLIQLQQKCPHKELNVWPAYCCMDIAKTGSIDMMKLAISQGCHLYPHTVHKAAEHGHIDLFKYLLTTHFLYDNLALRMQCNVWKNVIQQITKDHTGEMFQWCWDQGYRLPEYQDIVAECLNQCIKCIKVNSTSSNATWWRQFLFNFQVQSIHSHLHKKKNHSAYFDLYLQTVNHQLYQVIQPYQLHTYVLKCL